MATAQQQAPPPGAYFRIPGVGARPRFVEEVGPAQPAAQVTLAQGTSTPLGYGKFQTLDIDKGFLLQLAFTTTYTQGSGKTITVSGLSPTNMVSLLQVQFESAYSTMRLTGTLAAVMQSYRSIFAPRNQDTAAKVNGANTGYANGLGATFMPTQAISQANLGTNNFALNVTATPQTYNLFFEVPVSMYFDLYYELSATGQPMGMPIPRAVVSPQRMAATTRNVIPKVTAAPGFLTTDLYNAQAAIAAGDTTSTFTGTVQSTWWRDCWIPTDNMITEPPGRLWQYTRDYITLQPAGASHPAIPLDDDIPGQGQILSLVFFGWDPTLNSSNGAVIPYSDYADVQLLLGSTIQLEFDTPSSNMYRWLMKHGSILPNGFFGWDYMLTEDGRLTNENAINTLVQNGAQIRIDFATGYTPGAATTIYVGLEVLKKVGS
jgi:hypothetical protein